MQEGVTTGERLTLNQVMSVYTYGLTLEELQYAKDVLIKSYEDDAEMLHTTKSGHLVEELMDSVALGKAFVGNAGNTSVLTAML